MTAATFGGEEAVFNCMCVVLVRSMMCGGAWEHKCRLLTDEGKTSTYIVVRHSVVGGLR